MLTRFTIHRTFERYTIAVHVDCEMKEADTLEMWDRRIIREGSGYAPTILFAKCRTPEMAEAWVASFLESNARLARIQHGRAA